MFYTGVVESRSDPLELGRCQVRIVGLHTHDKTQLPTQQLPWATPVQPIGSAAMNGIGYTPVGPVEGTTVIIMFADDAMQQPIMLGTVGGIPQAPQAISDDDSATTVQSYNIKNIELRTVDGPTTGKILIFVDKETGKTNLTAGLTANMKVLGFGLSKDCYIVSIDSPTQISISELVTGYLKVCPFLHWHIPNRKHRHSPYLNYAFDILDNRGRLYWLRKKRQCYPYKTL